MNHQLENRRDFLKRASMAAIAFPFLISCKTDTAAQKTESVLSLIKKNAMPQARRQEERLTRPTMFRGKPLCRKSRIKTRR